MEWIATKPGFRGGRLIPKGGSFESDDFKGSWAVPKAGYEPEKPKDEETLISEAKEALQGRKAPSRKKRGKAKASK